MSGTAPLLPEGYRLLRYDTIGSTNDEAKALARAGAAEGTLVWAGEQTAGRGRRGRVWLSPPGNLYLSLIMRPAVAPARAAQLGFVAALGARRGARWRCRAGPRASLQMAERSARRRPQARRHPARIGDQRRANAVDFVVIGAGTNLASQPSGVEYPGHLAGANRVSRRRSGSSCCKPCPAFRCLGASAGATEGFAPVRAAWLARAAGVGEDIRVRLERATLFGRFLDLDEDGALLLEDGGRAAAASPPAKFSRLRCRLSERADAARDQRQQHQHRRSRCGTAPS